MAVAAAAAEAAAAAAHRAGLDGIEVACLVRVQIEHEFMEPLRAGDVVIKTLVMIGGSVVVKVVIPRHLITAGGVDHVVHNLEAKRFKTTTGKARPFQVLKVFILQPFHNPHVAIPGGQRSAVSVTEEIQATKTHAAVPRIAFRCRDHIRGVGTIGGLAGIHHALRHHRLRPAVLAHLAKLRLHRSLHQRGKFTMIRFGATPDANLKRTGRRALGQFGDDALVFLHLQRGTLGRIHQCHLRHLSHRIAFHQNGHTILHCALGILHLTYQRGNRCVQRAVLKAAHKGGLTVLLHTARLLEKLHIAHGVTEHHRVIGHITAAPFGLCPGQRPKGFLARISKAALGIGPTGQRAAAKFLIPGNARAGAVVTAEAHTVFREIIPRPPGRPAQQIGIKTHERLAPGDDRHALVGHGVLGEILSDRRLGVGKIRLQRPRQLGLPLRLLLREHSRNRNYGQQNYIPNRHHFHERRRA